MHEPSSLQVGLHETLVTEQLRSLIDVDEVHEHEQGRVDEADQAHVLTRHIAFALQRRLAAIKDPVARLDAANDLLRAIEGSHPLTAPVEQLLAVRRPSGPGHVARMALRPKTPLNDAALLTNAYGEPSLASELRAEIDSADTVDLLCAFVMWHGLRLIENELKAAHEAGVPIRVVTTTYIGGTESSTTPSARDFMPRPGSSDVTPASTRHM